MLFDREKLFINILFTFCLPIWTYYQILKSYKINPKLMFTFLFSNKKKFGLLLDGKISHGKILIYYT